MTEQEALDAAQRAYADYLAMSDLIAQEGGVNPNRLSGLVTPDQFQNEAEGLASYASNGFHLVGSSSFDSVHIANSDLNNFSLYLCIDNSNARIHNSENSDVTPTSRVDRWPLLVDFSIQSNIALVSGSETWTGTNFC